MVQKPQALGNVFSCIKAATLRLKRRLIEASKLLDIFTVYSGQEVLQESTNHLKDLKSMNRSRCVRRTGPTTPSTPTPRSFWSSGCCDASVAAASCTSDLRGVRRGSPMLGTNKFQSARAKMVRHLVAVGQKNADVRSSVLVTSR